MLSRYEQFSYIVSVINRQIQKLERDEMVKFGYKGAWAQYLAVMRSYPQGVTSAQLSDICDKDKAAVSRVVTEMEEKGVVVRRLEGDTLYRAKITLTAEGKKVADFVAARASAAVAAVGNELSDEERKIFYSTMDFISQKLQTLTVKGIPQK